MVNKKIDQNTLKLKIKRSGFRLTSPRKTILNIITNTKKELTAEEIFILAHKKNPGIGIATVYRTITLLEKFNILKKTSFEKNKTKYIIDGNVNLYENNKFSDKRIIYKKSENISKKDIVNTKTKQIPIELSSNYYNNTSEAYQEMSKINKIQTQLNEWIAELNKIKSEKETELEEIISDFKIIDKIIEKHEYSRNNLIQMLIDFQAEYNWLPKHILFYVGSKLNISLSQIYSIASFYKFFNLEPKGKYQILVCSGTACHVRGSISLLQRIINILKVKPGDTTNDFKFTLDTVNCLGCCALGPVLYFNNKYFSNPSAKVLEKLFNSVV